MVISDRTLPGFYAGTYALPPRDQTEVRQFAQCRARTVCRLAWYSLHSASSDGSNRTAGNLPEAMPSARSRVIWA